MSDMIVYISQSTLVFSAMYLIYRIALSRLTFHKLNRYILLSLIPISLILPLVNISAFSAPQVVSNFPLIENVSLTSPETIHNLSLPTSEASIDYLGVLMTVYLLGLLLFAAKLLLNIRTLMRSIRRSKVTAEEEFEIVLADTREVFSFFRWIFIPRSISDTCSDVVMEHEKAHVRLKHSLDIILSEIFIMIFWFNPLVFLYRKSLKSVHEYQADRYVLRKEIKASHYLQVLLQNLDISSPNNIYNYFNYPILKNRIQMITKDNSSPLRKLQYLALLPACLFFLLAFAGPSTLVSSEIGDQKALEEGHLPPSLFPVKNKSKEDISSFFGERRKNLKNGRVHNGIDIKANIGTPVVATADGIVSKAKMEGNWGNLIIISHSDGFQTWYAHLGDFKVKENQTVRKGEVIGSVGNTGLSTGPHLHYEVKHNGKRVDPMDYFTE